MKTQTLGVEMFKKFIHRTKVVAIALIVALAIITPAQQVFAAIPATWQANPSANDTLTWNAITWSSQLKIFVAVGATGVMTSPDGITWTQRTALAGTWRDVTWSPDLNLFVVVGTGSGSNNALTSPDGITWTTRSLASGVMAAIIWSPEQQKFIAVGLSAGSSATSTDGINWTFQSTPPNPTLSQGIAWSASDGLYVVTSSNTVTPGKVYTSPDGTTWTPRDMPNGRSMDVAYSSQYDLFVAVGFSGITTSPDGITWTTQTSPMINLRAVTWSPQNQEFVAVGTDGIVTSPNGVTWTPVTSPAANQWEDIVWSPELSRYVGVGSTGTNRTMVGIVPTAPSAPLTLTATLNAKNVNLSWNTPSFDGNSAITGYRIERSIKGGTFEVLVSNTNSSVTTYTDTNTAAGVAYTYRVYAINSQGQSVASNEALIQIPVSSAIGGGDTLANTGLDQGIMILLATIIVASGGILTLKLRRFNWDNL